MTPAGAARAAAGAAAARSRGAGRPGRCETVLALVILAAFALHAASFAFYTVEDAYISFRYARNLARGWGLVFNPGERVEGYSNFLWTVLLALGGRLGLAIPAAAKALGAALGLATVALTWVAARRMLPGRPHLALAAPLLAAGSAPLALWSVAGLETALFACLLMLGLLLATGGPAARRRPGWAGLTLGLAALTRPEGALSFALALAVTAAWGRRQGRPIGPAAARMAAGFGLVFLPHLAFRLAYYGDLVPNSYHVKSRRFQGGGWRYLRQALPLTGGVAPVLAAAAVLGRIPEEAALALAWILGHTAYVVYQGGDWMPMARYLAPLAPPAALAAAAGLARLLDLAGRGRMRRVAAGAACLAVLAGAALATGASWLRGRDVLRWEARNFAMWRAIAEHLAARARPGDVLATGLGGVIPYYSDLPVIDRGGLMNRDIARIVARAPDRTTENRLVDDYVLALRPRFMLIPGFIAIRDQPFGDLRELQHWELWRRPEFEAAYGLHEARIEWEGRLGYYPYFERRPAGLD